MENMLQVKVHDAYQENQARAKILVYIYIYIYMLCVLCYVLYIMCYLCNRMCYMLCMMCYVLYVPSQRTHFQRRCIFWQQFAFPTAAVQWLEWLSWWSDVTGRIAFINQQPERSLQQIDLEYNGLPLEKKLLLMRHHHLYPKFLKHKKSVCNYQMMLKQELLLYF